MGESTQHIRRASFGPFEVDFSLRQIRKHDLRIKVHDQPLQVLAMLVAQPNELVTREEIGQKLWPSGIFVDFENGMNSAVNRLRDALGDSADAPRYIETIPRRGYRFIAPVQILNGDGDQWVGTSHAPQSPLPQLATRVRRLRLFWIAAASLAAVALLGIFGVRALRVRLTPKIAFTADDWVMVSDFENRSGNSALDGVLQEALERELNNSQFVHVVPRERVQDVLALMRQPANSVLNRNVAREACLRDGGIKLLLAGQVEKIGGSYVLSTAVIDPHSDATLRSAAAEARNENEILDAIHHLGNDLRAALGEQLAQIRTSDLELERVTTPSLQALKLFSLGYDLQAQGGDSDGRTIPFFQKAVETDPEFATAWVHLGWALSNRGRGEPMPAFRRALQLADRVSERERLFILQSWYLINDQKEQATHYGDLLVRLYPDHFWGTSNQAGLLSGTSRDKETLELAKRCLRMRPNFSRALELFFDYRGTDDVSARKFLEEAKAISLRTGDPEAGFWLPYLDAADAWQRGDARSAASRLDATQPTTQYEVFLKATAYAALGKLRAATDAASGSPVSYEVDAMAAFLRNGVTGLGIFARQHPLPKTQTGSVPTILYAASGPDRPHQQIFEYINRKALAGVLPAQNAGVRGELALRQRDYKAAAKELQGALDHDATATVVLYPTGKMFLVDSLATAYERTGNLNAATKTLEKNIDSNELQLVFFPLLQQHLADLYRQAGDSSRADAIEKNLAFKLALADPDYSLAAQRRRE